MCRFRAEAEDIQQCSSVSFLLASKVAFAYHPVLTCRLLVLKGYMRLAAGNGNGNFVCCPVRPLLVFDWLRKAKQYCVKLFSIKAKCVSMSD